jgi:hypothetical protein
MELKCSCQFSGHWYMQKIRWHYGSHNAQEGKHTYVCVNAKLEYHTLNKHSVWPSSHTQPEMAVSRNLPWTYAVEHHMKTQLQCETDILCFHLTLRETQTTYRGCHISGASVICHYPQRANHSIKITGILPRNVSGFLRPKGSSKLDRPIFLSISHWMPVLIKQYTMTWVSPVFCHGWLLLLKYMHPLDKNINFHPLLACRNDSKRIHNRAKHLHESAPSSIKEKICCTLLYLRDC